MIPQNILEQVKQIITEHKQLTNDNKLEEAELKAQECRTLLKNYMSRVYLDFLLSGQIDSINGGIVIASRAEGKANFIEVYNVLKDDKTPEARFADNESSEKLASRAELEKELYELLQRRSALKFEINGFYGTQDSRTPEQIEALYNERKEIRKAINNVQLAIDEVDKHKAIVVGSGPIGTIGHIDHGKTTLVAATSAMIQQQMHKLDDVKDSISSDNGTSFDKLQEQSTAYTISPRYLTEAYDFEYKHANRCMHRQVPKNIGKKVKSKRRQAKQAKRKTRKK